MAYRPCPKVCKTPLFFIYLSFIQFPLHQLIPAVPAEPHAVCLRTAVGAEIGNRAGLRLARSRRCLGPVSYTHLEVYKRQLSQLLQPFLEFLLHPNGKDIHIQSRNPAVILQKGAEGSPKMTGITVV